jgi:outer membrane protein assembly factor BamD (BamD/ComL family)
MINRLLWNGKKGSIMKNIAKFFMIIGSLGLLTSCDVMEQANDRSREVNGYEKAALNLAKENRYLKRIIGDLKNDIQGHKSKISYLNLELVNTKQKKNKSRTIASVPAKDDLVKYGVYKWSPEKMLAVAEKEFDTKNFEKASQFFNSFLNNFPKSKKFNDTLLFQAGVSAFESGKHHGWTLKHLNRLITEYPESKFYRGAKLWAGLTHLDLGDNKAFFNTVEEFRKKYRNTPEWKILSSRYEKLIQKYK